MFDARYCEEIKQLYLKARKDEKYWQETKFGRIWNEKQFLADNGVYNLETDAIIAEYPKIVYKTKDNLEKTIDKGGMIDSLNTKLKQLKEEKFTAWIEYFPKFYTYFRIVRTEEDKNDTTEDATELIKKLKENLKF